MSKTIEYKPRSLWPFALVIAIAVVFIAAPTKPSMESGYFDFLASSCVVLVTWFLLYRAMRSSVIADADGVLVRNPFTSQRYRWEEIDEFRARGGYLGSRIFGSPATMWLADGTKRYLIAIQPPWLIEWGNVSSNRRACERLNEFRSAALESRCEPSSFVGQSV